MKPITVLIPSRFNTPGLLSLAPSLLDADKVYILDNGFPPEDIKPILQTIKNSLVINCHGKSIYDMWNLGQDIAHSEFGDHYTAILNDDIAIQQGTLTKLAEVLDSYEDIGAVCPDYTTLQASDSPRVEYTTSTFGNGGLAGFAFMIRSSLQIRVDPHFKWWYGDDDLVGAIESAGMRVAILRGVPLAHIQGFSSRLIQTEIDNMIFEDRIYFNNKYGEHR